MGRAGNAAHWFSTGLGTEDSCSSSINRLLIRTTVLVRAIQFTRIILYTLA